MAAKKSARTSKKVAEKSARKTARKATRAKVAREPAAPGGASARIDARIAELADWRGATLQRAREIVRAADPRIVEEWKWENPVWSCDGIVCTGETYKQVVKLTFAHGASLADPAGLFNSSLAGNVRRAIDVREGERIDAAALRDLVRAAVARNSGGAKTAKPAQPVLLAGGNPQIPKGEGDAPVQAYIAAMPGWKRDVGRRLDRLIERHVPDVRKAVKWNSPFYGIDGQGWFLGMHVFTRYVKVTFFRGASLRPAPPGGSSKDARWIDLHEDDFDEARMAKWIRQAAALPGWGGT